MEADVYLRSLLRGNPPARAPVCGVRGKQPEQVVEYLGRWRLVSAAPHSLFLLPEKGHPMTLISICKDCGRVSLPDGSYLNELDKPCSRELHFFVGFNDTSRLSRRAKLARALYRVQLYFDDIGVSVTVPTKAKPTIKMLERRKRNADTPEEEKRVADLIKLLHRAGH